MLLKASQVSRGGDTSQEASNAHELLRTRVRDHGHKLQHKHTNVHLICAILSLRSRSWAIFFSTCASLAPALSKAYEKVRRHHQTPHCFLASTPRPSFFRHASIKRLQPCQQAYLLVGNMRASSKQACPYARNGPLPGIFTAIHTAPCLLGPFPIISRTHASRGSVSVKLSPSEAYPYVSATRESLSEPIKAALCLRQGLARASMYRRELPSR